MSFIPDTAKLSQIFANAVAPAFFLGAVAAFVSLMTARLAGVNERIRGIVAQDDSRPGPQVSNPALPPLLRRARLLADGIVLSLGSGMCATVLLAILFASQFLGLGHAYGAALLFVIATVLLGIALFRFAQEAMHARKELEESYFRVPGRQPPALRSGEASGIDVT